MTNRIRTKAHDRRRPSVPRRLHAAPSATRVVLRWHHSTDDTGVAAYEVRRGTRRIARTGRTTYTDSKVRADTAYAYRVRAVDRAGRAGAWSPAVTVHVPAGGGFSQGTPPGPAGPPGATGDVPITPPPDPPVIRTLDARAVDRLFWRAGFGPSPADRTAWVGRPVADLVDWFLSTPAGSAPTTTPALAYDYQSSTYVPIDPIVSDDELVASWLEAMRLARNPLVERLTFFWHRHWAVSRESGAIDQRHLVAYTERLRRYADLGAHPDASFRDLAREMTTDDAAMNIYLDGRDNQYYGTASVPNENYGREFMELFTLGVSDPATGRPSYGQDDVHALARCFTGYAVQDDDTRPAYGRVLFDPRRADVRAKSVFGTVVTPIAASAGRPAVAQAQVAVDLVLGRPQHAPHLIRRLWGEFIPAPIPDATLAALVQVYRDSGLKLKPVIRAILSDPLLLDSPDEPTMIKPPVVFAVGVLRALGSPVLANTYPSLTDGLEQMQQVPYFPPNVSGWEGGLSWMNTSTARARFDFVLRCLDARYNGYPGSTAPADPGAESPQAALDRALDACGSPWLPDAARAQLLTYATSTLKGTTGPQRIQRQYTLIALILGGPDGQVM